VVSTDLVLLKEFHITVFQNYTLSFDSIKVEVSGFPVAHEVGHAYRAWFHSAIRKLHGSGTAASKANQKFVMEESRYINQSKMSSKRRKTTNEAGVKVAAPAPAPEPKAKASPPPSEAESATIDNASKQDIAEVAPKTFKDLVSLRPCPPWSHQCR